MHSCQDIEENRFFCNGGTNLPCSHNHPRLSKDNTDDFLQGPQGMVNAPTNLVQNSYVHPNGRWTNSE